MDNPTAFCSVTSSQQITPELLEKWITEIEKIKSKEPSLEETRNMFLRHLQEMASLAEWKIIPTTHLPSGTFYFGIDEIIKSKI